jgi:hypothetical protein
MKGTEQMVTITKERKTVRKSAPRKGIKGVTVVLNNRSGSLQADTLAKAATELQRVLMWLYVERGAHKFYELKQTLRLVVTTETAHGSKLAMCNGRSYYRHDAFKDSKNGELLGMINITPETFRSDYNDTNLPERLTEALLHELVHLINASQGIKDISKGRHNLRFKKLAEKVGLVVTEGEKKVGFGITTLGKQAIGDMSRVRFNEEPFRIYATESLEDKDSKTSERLYNTWYCPKHPTNEGAKAPRFRVESKHDFDIACVPCSERNGAKGWIRYVKETS